MMQPETAVDFVGSLQPHQLDFVESVVSGRSGRRVVLADEVGMGKTFAAAALIAQLQEAEPGRRILVVVPAALLQPWQAILRRFRLLGTVTVDGPTLRLLEARTAADTDPLSSVRVALVTEEFLGRDKQRLGRILATGWDLTILDEARYPRRQQGSTFEELWRSDEVGVLVAMKADLKESELAAAGLHPSAIFHRRRVDLAWKDLALETSQPQLELRSVRYSAEEVRLFDEVMRVTASPVEPGVGLLKARAGSSLATLEQWLLKATSGPNFESAAEDAWEVLSGMSPDGDEVVEHEFIPIPPRTIRRLQMMIDEVEIDSKLNAVDERLRQALANGIKHVAVVSQFADTIRYISSHLSISEIETSAVEITGSTPPDERQAAIEAFRKNGGVLLITDIAVWGAALGFVEECFHFDIPSAPVLVQRVGRFDRMASKFERHVAFPDDTFHDQRSIEAAFSALQDPERWNI